MDNLSTCMICKIDLTDNALLEQANDSTNVVVVSDATCLGFEHNDDMVSFEINENEPYRAVYCNECWGTLVAHSWSLVKDGYRSKQLEHYRKEK